MNAGAGTKVRARNNRRPVTGARAARPGRSSRGRQGLGQRIRRARSTRRRGRALLIWLALLAALAGGVVFLFFWSAAFVVKDIQVSGGRDEVQESAVQLARIPHGRPLARVSEGAVTERVLTDRRIAEIVVERDWPSTVRLTVTERDPVLALTGGGQTWLADADGAVYEQVEQASNKLPRFRVRGNPEELDATTVAGLAQLWRTRPDPDLLKGQLSSPRVAADGTVTMELENSSLQWGPPTENEKKWQVVRALLGQEAVDPAVQQLTIDVRLPDTPVVSGLPASTG